MNYKLWVNEDRTVMVRLWDNGDMEVATRRVSWHTWGPPVIVLSEAVTP